MSTKAVLLQAANVGLALVFAGDWASAMLAHGLGCVARRAFRG